MIGVAQIDWREVETMTDSARRPYYAAALAQARAHRDELQEALFAAIDQVAWLTFKLHEAERFDLDLG